MVHVLPPFPVPPLGEPWPPNVLIAAQGIDNSFTHASHCLTYQNADPIRLVIQLQNLATSCLPLIEALARTADLPGAIQEWLYGSAVACQRLIEGLQQAHAAARGTETLNVAFLRPISTIHTGEQGRPAIRIDPAILHAAVAPNRHIPLTRLAKALGVHRHTLRDSLRLNNIEYGFTPLSDADLDLLVKTYTQHKPESGIRYVTGFLRHHGFKIQRHRIIQSLQRVDPIGRTLQERQAIIRRVYSVTRPNALWHIDGHHKLIRWGVVLHGIVDGYARSAVGLRASNNNRALTVRDGVFHCATNKYGYPSRVRGDHGGENKEVAIEMILVRGPNRGSFIWGSSTRNTRIERLWVEVGTQFARRWRGFFLRLERLHYLDVENPSHLWLLHALFLNSINNDCDAFCDEWNAHPISGLGHGRSPNDMRLLGQLEHGVYVDNDLEDVPPEELAEHYGVDNQLSDEDSSDSDDSEPDNAVPEDADNQTEVQVPDSRNPFTDGESENIFREALRLVREQEIIPAGYNILPQEWEDGIYPTIEVIRAGRRGRRDITVGLDDEIWRPRAILWVQAVEVLTRVVDNEM